jgi:hypothetical protein
MRKNVVSICSNNKQLLRSILAILGFNAWVFTIEDKELYRVVVVLKRRDGEIIGVQYAITTNPERLCATVRLEDIDEKAINTATQATN